MSRDIACRVVTVVGKRGRLRFCASVTDGLDAVESESERLEHSGDYVTLMLEGDAVPVQEVRNA